MSKPVSGRPGVTRETSTMVPLMTRAMYDRFQLLREEVERQDGAAAQVFVPLMPGAASAARPEILFIGQATRGWATDEIRDYDAATLRAEQLVRTPPSRSGFWQVVREITRKTRQGVDHSVIPDLTRSMGWSNLIKIGHPKRNPGQAFWKAQAELCVEQLRHEIDVMKPTAVMLLTRNLAQRQIVEPIFGKDDWEFDTKEKDRVAWKTLGRPIIWMNHPRNMGPSSYRAASIAKAVDLTLAVL
jgi:hypothetical protein